MILPQLKALHSPDLYRDALPPDPADCVVLVQATIGPSEVQDGDTFDVLVVTRTRLQATTLPRWGCGMLIVEAFSWEVVEHAIERLLSHAMRESRAEVASQLGKELLWEFENYKSKPSAA